MNAKTTGTRRFFHSHFIKLTFLKNFRSILIGLNDAANAAVAVTRYIMRAVLWKAHSNPLSKSCPE